MLPETLTFGNAVARSHFQIDRNLTSSITVMFNLMGFGKAQKPSNRVKAAGVTSFRSCFPSEMVATAVRIHCTGP